MKKFNKKFFIGMGTIAAVATPVAAVISCGGDNKGSTEKKTENVSGEFTSADIQTMLNYGLINMIKKDEALTKKFLNAIKNGYMKEHTQDIVNKVLGSGFSKIVGGLLKGKDLNQIVGDALSIMKDMDVDSAYSALKAIATQPLKQIKKTDLQNVLTLLNGFGISQSITGAISSKLDLIWQVLKAGFKTLDNDKYKGITDAIKNLLPKEITEGKAGEVFMPILDSAFKPIKSVLDGYIKKGAPAETTMDQFVPMLISSLTSNAEDTEANATQAWTFQINKVISETKNKDNKDVKEYIKKLKAIIGSKGIIKGSSEYLSNFVSPTEPSDTDKNRLAELNRKSNADDETLTKDEAKEKNKLRDAKNNYEKKLAESTKLKKVDSEDPYIISENGGIFNSRSAKDVTNTLLWIKNSIVNILTSPTFINFVYTLVLPSADPNEKSPAIDKSTANIILDILSNEQLARFMKMDITSNISNGIFDLINTGLTKDTFDSVYTSVMQFLDPTNGVTSAISPTIYGTINGDFAKGVIKRLLFGN